MFSRQVLLAGIIVSFCSVILAVDLLIPLGFAAGVIYLLPMFATIWLQKKTYIIFIALLCSILTFIGLVYSPSGGEYWQVLLNRLLAIFVIWMTTGFIFMRRKMEGDLVRYGRIFEVSQDEIYVIDAKSLKIILANNAALQNLGYTIDEIMELTVLDLKPEHTFDSISKLINPLFTGDKEQINFESNHKRKDGTLYPVEVHLQTLEYNKTFAAIVSDITERKSQELEVSNISKQHVALSEVAQLAISELGLDELLEQICLLISNVLELEYCMILGFFSTEQSSIYKAVVGFKQELIKDKKQLLDPNTLAGHTFQSAQVQIMEDSQNESRFESDELLYQYNIKSGIGIPINSEEIIQGVICAYSENEMIFRNYDIYFLKSVASIVHNYIQREHAAAAIKESEARLRNITDSMFSFVGVIDLIGILIFTNKAPLDRASLSHDDVYGKPFTDTPWWSYSSEVQTRLRNALHQASKGEVVRYDEVVRMGETDFITIDVSFGPLRDSAGNIVQIIASAVDITDRIKAETRLKESEEHLNLATAGSSDGLWDWNIETNEEWWSKRFYELLGYKEGEIESSHKQFLKLLHPDSAKGISAETNDHLDMDKGYDINIRLKTKSGEYKWFNSRGKAIRNAENVPVRMAGSIQDITERINQEEIIKRKTKELEDSKNKLRQLTARVERIREEERTSIAREVHDELGQAFTALKFDVAWLKNKLDQEKTELIEKLDSMSDFISVNSNIVRKISSELRPPVLDDFGLSAAVEWYCYDMKQKIGLDYEHNIDIIEMELSIDLRTVLYRIFQEALTNIVRHSKADKYWVNMDCYEGHILLQISDNGIGVDEEKLDNSSSLGILGMNERIQPYGGSVLVKNDKKYGGTQVSIYLPLSRIKN
jgi:two-component system, NarL family, sensor histidine kinase UhpB